MVEDETDEHDYLELANILKDQGNEAFQAGQIEKSIQLYSQAIGVDPDNHVLYSNRSAAFLKEGSKSKALYDAEKCVALAPNWPKGYSRLGAAQQGLRRFELAIDSFKKGIELDPNNQSIWESLRLCNEAFGSDKQVRFAAASIERAQEEEKLKRNEEIKEAAKRSAALKASEIYNKEKEKEIAADNNVSKANEADLLDSFFSEIQADGNVQVPIAIDVAPSEDLLSSFFADVTKEQADKAALDEAKSNSRDESTLTEKYINQSIGSSDELLERLVGPHYQWKNLNPYRVLQLDIDATDEDIRYRYKKLSTKVHPDKLRTVDNAREAFEEVKIAYQKLMEEDQKKVVVMNIEYVRDEFAKERRKLLQRGIKESDLPNYEDDLDKKTMKHFADMEMSKKRSETNLRTYNARDRMAEDKEKEMMKVHAEFEKNWSEENRRDDRVHNWRGFQDVPEAKRAKVSSSSYKEEHREDKKHGAAKLETWKKKWK